jgi:hypothetical protein
LYNESFTTGDGLKALSKYLPVERSVLLTALDRNKVFGPMYLHCTIFEELLN